MEATRKLTVETKKLTAITSQLKHRESIPDFILCICGYVILPGNHKLTNEPICGRAAK